MLLRKFSVILPPGPQLSVRKISEWDHLQQKNYQRARGRDDDCGPIHSIATVIVLPPAFWRRRIFRKCSFWCERVWLLLRSSYVKGKVRRMSEPNFPDLFQKSAQVDFGPDFLTLLKFNLAKQNRLDLIEGPMSLQNACLLYFLVRSLRKVHSLPICWWWEKKKIIIRLHSVSVQIEKPTFFNFEILPDVKHFKAKLYILCLLQSSLRKWDGNIRWLAGKLLTLW